MAARPLPRLDVRSAARVLSAGLAVALAVAALAFAREFRLDAVREFRFAWGTWAGALVLAFAAGALFASAVSLRLRRVAAVVVVLGAAAVLAHLPIVLIAGPASRWWGALATTSFLDRTGPQLLAAALAGTAIAASLAGRSARRRGRQPVE